MLAAAEEARARVAAQRGEAVEGDAAACVTNLFDHYAEWGDASLRLLAGEESSPAIAALAAEGRATHAAWIERVFRRALSRRRGRPRRLLRAQLIVACDVSTWKLLVRDMGLPRAEAEAAVLGIVEALCAPGGA